MNRRWNLLLALLLVSGAAAPMTSCGGGGGGEGGNLVLVGFNHPNISGILLNEPLIFTFNKVIDQASINLDTLRVVGAQGPFFEFTVVDGNLVGLGPRTPNFADFSDVGLYPGVTYTVDLPIHPAVDTIRTPDGTPLGQADLYTFTTVNTHLFVEPRRPISHGLPPSQGGTSDDEGCLQNPTNALFVPPSVDPSVIQTGSGPGAKLLCLRNEGPPRIIAASCTPLHNQSAVGVPSAVGPGLIELPAIRLPVNEPLNPLTVEPYVPSTKIPVNVQLWRVALKDGTAIAPERIATNKPIVVQTVTDVEILLVAAGPVQQGIYLVNVIPQVKDLPGNPLQTSDRPNPAIGGFNVYEASPAFNTTVPAGWRLYFSSVTLPNTALAISEDFATNFSEWGDLSSTDTEPGIYTESIADTKDSNPDGLPLSDTTGGDPTPLRTLTYSVSDPTGASIGQSTSANWNNGVGTGYRFLNLPGVTANPDASSGAGVLRATWKPYTGTGEDGIVNTAGTGVTLGLNTTSGSADGDGIYEYQSLTLAAGDTLDVTGDNPALVLVRGNVTLSGLVKMNGGAGGPGLDTDGSTDYTNPGAAPAGGAGGLGGAGAGDGGAGANPVLGQPGGQSGGLGDNLFGTYAGEHPTANGGGGAGGLIDPSGIGAGSGGGGGGGHGAAGAEGAYADATLAGAGGDAVGEPFFDRLLTAFEPDRGYFPMCNVAGGSGGGGGSVDDDNGVSETGNDTADNGDDGGGGGGGGGGALIIVCGGDLTVNSAANLQAVGGNGGNTYARAEQTPNFGGNGVPGGGDDSIIGVGNPLAPGTGEGGPGGGGAGGAILLIAKDNLVVNVGAVLSAVGGAGGTSGDPDRVGGAGGEGRITLVTFDGSSLPTMNGTATPTASLSTGASDQYHPTVDLASAGQSEWVDLVTPTVDFNPDPDGPGGQPPSVPTFVSNAAFLASQGLVMGPAGDFDLVWEFQGADDLVPLPGGVSPPAAADGLTDWVDVSGVDLLDTKRFFRWRFRFLASDAFPGHGLSALPLPEVDSLEIPFTK